MAALNIVRYQPGLSLGTAPQPKNRRYPPHFAFVGQPSALAQVEHDFPNPGMSSLEPVLIDQMLPSGPRDKTSQKQQPSSLRATAGRAHAQCQRGSPLPPAKLPRVPRGHHSSAGPATRKGETKGCLTHQYGSFQIDQRRSRLLDR